MKRSRKPPVGVILSEQPGPRRSWSFLSHELGAAYGLGGRDRRGADTAEKMRKAVGNRIRDSIGRISTQHSGLGRHLANAIATGTFCSYRPDREISWEL